MKSLIALICFILANAATAQSTCIPSTFAEDDVVVDYEEMNAEKIAELAAVQKEYADFAEQVRGKKSRDNKIELTNAFVDAAGMAYLIHAGVRMFKTKGVFSVLRGDLLAVTMSGGDPDLKEVLKNLDDTKKAELKKILGKNYEAKTLKLQASMEKQLAGIVDLLETADEEGKKSMIRKLFTGKIDKLKSWWEALKDMNFLKQTSEVMAASAKQIGFASLLLAVPLGVYVSIAKIKEQQRLVQLTAEQDKVMKQALLLEMFLNQKSFAELAATRAKLQPNRVCPPAS